MKPKSMKNHINLQFFDFSFTGLTIRNFSFFTFGFSLGMAEAVDYAVVGVEVSPSAMTSCKRPARS
jgi:hypothetical protein